MNRYILIGLFLTLISSSTHAKSDNDKFEDERLDEKQLEMIKEEMEESPSATPFGGARSGNLDLEKQKDDEKMQHDLEKQRQLYEYEGNYRKGL